MSRGSDPSACFGGRNTLITTRSHPTVMLEFQASSDSDSLTRKERLGRSGWSTQAHHCSIASSLHWMYNLTSASSLSEAMTN
eukprot:3494677-Rhodomonas_salina.1